MNITNQGRTKLLAMVVLFVSVASCATINVLKIQYRFQAEIEKFSGQKIYVSIRDARTVKEIFGSGAQNDFRGSSNEFYFKIGKGDGSETEGVLYDPAGAILKGLKLRLENLGFFVLDDMTINEPELMIVLNEFSLDLKAHNWIAKISYEAFLLREEKKVASQSVSGQSERYKFIGRGEADVAMGEIFTDVLNRLDIVKLLTGSDST